MKSLFLTLLAVVGFGAGFALVGAAADRLYLRRQLGAIDDSRSLLERCVVSAENALGAIEEEDDSLHAELAARVPTWRRPAPEPTETETDG